MTLILDSQVNTVDVLGSASHNPTKAEAALLSVFPEWDKKIVRVARFVDDVVIGLAKKHGLWDENLSVLNGGTIEPNQLIQYILKVKGPNVLGVVGGMVQDRLEGRENLAILAALLTRIVWDVPDFGDFVNIRKQEDTNKLFAIPRSVFTGEQLYDQILSDPRYQPLIGFLNDLKNVTEEYVGKVFNTLSLSDSVLRAKSVIGTMIGEYGESVGIMHVQDENIRKFLKKQHLISVNSTKREVLPWLNNPDMWYLSQVNTLGILGMVNEVSCTPGIGVGEIDALHLYYDQVTSFSLVVFDDVNDVEEDAKNGDPNFFKDLLAGDHLEQVKLMENQYGKISDYNGYQESKVLATKYFFALLGRAYLEKERGLLKVFGRERAYKHQKMFRDMVKFYTLHLMLAGKQFDAIEICCMNIFSFEIGDIVAK